MNILLKAGSLPNLLTITLMEMEINIFETVTWPHVPHLVKGSCLEVSLCQHLAYCGIDTSSACKDMYIICHLTQQDHSVEMSCVFMGQSSSSHVTTLKSLVTITILIVRKKNASTKTSYKYVLTLKNWVDWITAKREKKCPKYENGTFWEEVPSNFSLQTCFSPYDYLP